MPSSPPLTATGRSSIAPIATESTPPSWPRERLAERREGPQVPHPDGAVVAAADRDRPAVDRADRDRVDPALVAGERLAQRREGPQVPHPDGAVVAAADRHRPVVDRADRDRVDRAVVAGERLAQRREGPQVPHPDGAVVAAADRHRPVIDHADGDRGDRALVAEEGHVAGRRAPPSAGDAPGAVGQEGRDPVGDHVGAPHPGGELEVAAALVGGSATEVRRGQLDDGGRLPRLGRGGVPEERQEPIDVGDDEEARIGEQFVEPAAGGGVGGQVGRARTGRRALQSALPARVARGQGPSTIAAWVSAASTGQTAVLVRRRAGTRRTSGGRPGTGRRVAGPRGTGRDPR